jgi:circadian clock protein KaiC
MAKMETGNDGLDYILEGGFPEYSISLVSGLPGTGKTILAEQICFSMTKQEKKALYISTASEPLAKRIRYVQDFSFYDESFMTELVMFETVGDLLRSGDIKGSIERIKDLVKTNEPDLLVIDSFKVFHNFSISTEELTRLFSDLATFLSELAVTSLWVGEYTSREMGELPEFVIVDGIIELYLASVDVRERRYLKVLKMRGSGYFGGEHPLNITSNGLNIFPRLTASTKIIYPEETVRRPIGVEFMDEAIEGGIGKGSSTVIFGPSGSGKTISSLLFIFAGIKEGEKGLITTLGENPTQVILTARSLGFDAEKAIQDGMLEIMYFPPDSVYIDEFSRAVIDKVNTERFKRVVVDSLIDLEATTQDPIAFRNFTYAIVQHMTVRGISLLMTYEVTELYQVTKLSSSGVSHMAENAIVFNFRYEGMKICRVYSVIKTRGTKHMQEVRYYEITSNGISIVDKDKC